MLIKKGGIFREIDEKFLPEYKAKGYEQAKGEPEVEPQAKGKTKDK